MSTGPNETAALGVGAQSGGKEVTKHVRRNYEAKGPERSSLKLAPAWNDHGQLSGWISLVEAAVLVLPHVGGEA